MTRRQAVAVALGAFLLGLACGLSVSVADEPPSLRTTHPRTASLVGRPLDGD